jgi:UMF1 family MFS transporter
MEYSDDMPLAAQSQSPQRKIWLWASYDFANSLGFIGVSFYFGLWFLTELGGSDVWMSGAVAASTLLLLVTLPFLGHFSDAMGRRMPFLMGMTLLCILSMLGLGIAGSGLHSLDWMTTLLIILFYFLFQYSYQASFAFYHAFLRDLSTKKYTAERISGFGMGWGQIGNLLGLVLLFPIAQGTIPFPGSGKPTVFIAAAILFFLCSLPVFFFFRAPGIVSTQGSKLLSVGDTLRGTLRDFRAIRRHPGVVAYLITYYLFADAVLTLTLFITSYLDAVGHLDDKQKNIVLFASALFGMLGAYISPLFIRLFGSRKKALGAFIGSWVIVISMLAVARTPVIFAVAILLNGFVYGVLFSLSRAFFALLIPRDKQVEFFSVYVLFERAASILGPLVWSGVAFLFIAHGPDRYRFSMASLAILVALSFVALRYVKEPSNEGEEGVENA